MDAERFDGLVRTFGQRRSRRQTLGGLAGAGAALIGLLAATPVAADNKPGNNHPGNNKPGSGQNGPPGNSQPGNSQSTPCLHTCEKMCLDGCLRECGGGNPSCIETCVNQCDDACEQRCS
jgi:hypothetical protein